MFSAAKTLLRLAVALAVALGTAAYAWPAGADEIAPAEDTAAARWYFQTSLYTKHFHYDPVHNDHQHLVNIEWIRADNFLVGGAYLRNSFDQPTEYLYIGKLWRPFDSAPLLHVKLTGGLIHGYKQPYQDKIPYNGSGIAPGILPAVGLSGKNFATEVVFFGNSGLMWTAGFYWH